MLASTGAIHGGAVRIDKDFDATMVFFSLTPNQTLHKLRIVAMDNAKRAPSIQQTRFHHAPA